MLRVPDVPAICQVLEFDRLTHRAGRAQHGAAQFTASVAGRLGAPGSRAGAKLDRQPFR